MFLVILMCDKSDASRHLNDEVNILVNYKIQHNNGVFINKNGLKNNAGKTMETLARVSSVIFHFLLELELEKCF